LPNEYEYDSNLASFLSVAGDAQSDLSQVSESTVTEPVNLPTGRLVSLAPQEPAEARCPNCSSMNTKSLSFNANTFSYAVYSCRTCAHVWRLPRLMTSQQP
jgi:hypothetical protein